jgi:hypothetical protein
LFRLKGPGLEASPVRKMDLTAQPLSEVKAPPPQLGVPTVYDVLQGEAEVKLLDLKDKQVEGYVSKMVSIPYCVSTCLIFIFTVYISTEELNYMNMLLMKLV